jgi:hypothetical protein
MSNREASELMVPNQDLCDQKARDDEEYVNADITPGKACNAKMESYNRYHGDGTEAVNVWPVSGLLHARFPSTIATGIG